MDRDDLVAAIQPEAGVEHDHTARLVLRHDLIAIAFRHTEGVNDGVLHGVEKRADLFVRAAFYHVDLYEGHGLSAIRISAWNVSDD